ncbi:3-oxoacyl-[acyl-carrier-protein] reductase [Ruminococcaceae bacterium KH2T8]|nr:3-oxoacyl-[acyl-carrier-protein] reductase [Ruminococcaceae bacterium KH2T8]
MAKTAIVTGSARGIGKGIAVKLAKMGYNIAVVDACPIEGSQETADEIAKEYGVQTKAYRCDVSSSASVAETVADVASTFGTIDALVNNAGITRDGFLVRMKEEDFDAVISVNLKGTYNFFREVVPVMSKQKYGRIVSISSIVGLQGNACQVNYSASKAGVIGITKSAAREYAGKNITCNAIAPGFVQTPMTDVLPEKVKEQMLAGIPLKRYGQVEDIANAVGFLVSDEASYITGQVLSVDGGMHM